MKFGQPLIETKSIVKSHCLKTFPNFQHDTYDLSSRGETNAKLRLRGNNSPTNDEDEIQAVDYATHYNKIVTISTD